MEQKHFPSFYRKHAKQIYRFLYYRVGGDKEKAQDLTQDVFLKAYQAFERYDERVSENAWIFTIARNHLLNTIAKTRRVQVIVHGIGELGFEICTADERRLP